jgi:methyl-accepting chemotaxis protein
VEEQTEAIGETTEAIAGFVTVITEVALQMSPVLERASQPGTPVSVWLPAMTEVAKAMAEPSSGLREACTRFAGQMVEMDTAVQAAFDVIATMPPEQRAGSPTGFLEQMVSIGESAHEVVAVLGEVEVGMRWLAKMSRELRAPVRDISAAVKQFSGMVTRIADWERRARALM